LSPHILCVAFVAANAAPLIGEGAAAHGKKPTAQRHYVFPRARRSM